MVLVRLGSLFFPEYLEILVKVIQPTTKSSFEAFSFYTQVSRTNFFQILVEVVKVTLMFLPMLIGFFMGFKLLFGDVSYPSVLTNRLVFKGCVWFSYSKLESLNTL
jgi:hypothetical protein